MTFEMVAGPGDAPTTNANNNTAATTSSSSLSMPELSAIKSAPSTPLADTLPPPPEEVQPTPATRQPTPATKPVTTTTVPKPQIKSPPVPKPQPKLSATTARPTPTNPQVMTAQQFQQSHGITATSASTAQSTAPHRGTITAPDVHVGPISTSGTIGGNAAGGRGAARVATGPSDEDNKNYIAELVARLQAAFQLPGDVPSLTDEVVLTIAANGTVVSHQRQGSSGNAQFDAAVDAALSQITNVSPPPGGKQVTYQFKYSPSGN
jgi:hypothetical protein